LIEVGADFDGFQCNTLVVDSRRTIFPREINPEFHIVCGVNDLLLSSCYQLIQFVKSLTKRQLVTQFPDIRRFFFHFYFDQIQLVRANT